ncbi:MAG: hypothetical protein K2O66_04925 [Bacteroidales bacterium]|nr:hypothetical protein [Bacteroidales bacterium]MDE7072686.1 hypothetical protein [Bacteroidales bacterium]
MKRFLLWAIACLLPLLTSAQVRKVAILEAVDREGNVPYAHKLMLRSNLAKAITSAEGYEAYDRTDMDAIMGEQNFQRTGMVSDDQIRRLGEMTGAAYILVAEAAIADEKSMFITAKILNVETAKTEVTENVLMGNSPSEIQIGCTELANKLLGLNIQSTNLLIQPKPATQEEAPPVAARQTNISNQQERREGIGSLKVFPDGSKGIVFFEDETGGLAVSLDQVSVQWENAKGRKFNNIIALIDEGSASTYFIKGKGLEQTRSIVNQIGVMAPAANWCTNHGYGWYLPSAGELYYLLVVANEKKRGQGRISRARMANGGAPLDGRWFWCSNEHDRKEAFNVSNGGSIDTEDKNELNYVVAVRAF